jgi:hypothetical protein
MPLLLRRLERDDDVFPGLQVFQPNHTVGISGLQNLRALQSEVLPVAIGSRYAVYGNLELRAMDTFIAPQSSFHFARAFPTLGILRCEMTSLSRAKSLLRIYAPKLPPVREEIGC